MSRPRIAIIGSGFSRTRKSTSSLSVVKLLVAHMTLGLSLQKLIPPVLMNPPSTALAKPDSM